MLLLSDLFEVQFPYLLNDDFNIKFIDFYCMLDEIVHKADKEGSHS